LAPQVIRYVKDYDIIHVHGVGFFSDLLSLTKHLHKKPLVLSTHGGIFHTKRIMFLKKLYFYKWSRMTLKNFDSVFAHSINDKKLFEEIIEKEKISLVPYSIYYKDYQKPGKIRKNSMLFVGRFDGNKRIDRLINILKLVSEKIKKTKLVLVGGHIEDHKDLFSLMKKTGMENRIVSVGTKHGKDLVRYYSNAHVFVSAADYEGFGISALEAMAAGRPVVVNDITAFNNFIRNKKNGHVIDFSDEEKTADLVVKVLRSNQSSISKNAKRTAKSYDWSVGVKLAINAYEKLV